MQQGQSAVQVSAIDVERWQLIRLQLSDAAPIHHTQAEIYEVLYLARPQLAQLPD